MNIPFFLYDLITSNAWKLEFAESNLIMEKIRSSLSVCWLGFLSFSFSFTFYLSHSTSLSLILSFSLNLSYVIMYYPDLTRFQLN